MIPRGLLFIASQQGTTSDPETWPYFMLLKQLGEVMQLGSGLFVRTFLSLDFISKRLSAYRVCGVCLNLTILV